MKLLLTISIFLIMVGLTVWKNNKRKKHFMEEVKKPIHAKPSLYAYYFEALKGIAKEFGYNLVLHGSLNRDLDLIAIPWVEDPKPEMELINAISKYMNGWTTDSPTLFLHNKLPGGRNSYVIQLNRGGYMNTGTGLHEPLTEGREVPEYIPDPQYYIDISVTPLLKS